MATRASHKARGATFETDIKDFARAQGYDAERLARTGAKDEGDVVIRGDFFGSIGVLEAKAPGGTGKIDLPGWMREAQLEAQHYADARDMQRDTILAAVVIKARGKSIADAYVVMRLGDILVK